MDTLAKQSPDVKIAVPTPPPSEEKPPDTALLDVQQQEIKNAQAEIGQLHALIDVLRVSTANLIQDDPEFAADFTTADLLRSQANQVTRQLTGIPAEPSHLEEDKLRQEVRTLERSLGITTPAQRVLEASLFIDPPFLKIALFRGDEHPEELFGIRAWKGWLEARKEAKGVDRLSVDTIVKLHSLVSQGLSPEIQGNISNTSRSGGDYTNLGSPLSLTEEQLSAIESNPLLRFHFTDREKRKGYLVYPSVEDAELFSRIRSTLPAQIQEGLNSLPISRKLITVLLEELARDYNTEASHDRDKVIAQAADLQRHFISIHPFLDGNGRLSRLLMNWYLEKSGLSPSVLEYGEDDLFFTRDAWIAEVAEGVGRYEQIKNTAINEVISPRETIIDPQLLEFYDQIYVRYSKPPVADAPMFHKEYRRYLEDLHTEYERFKNFTEVTKPSPDEWKIESSVLHQGGLIPTGYIKQWGDTRPDVQRNTRDQYYTSQEVYRGGMAAEIGDTRDILRLFTTPTAINASYRVLARQHIEPMSIKPIPLSRVRSALEAYNEILKSDFHARVHPDKPAITPSLAGNETSLWNTIGNSEMTPQLSKYLNEGVYLSHLLHNHQLGSEALSIWASPAVSTSVIKNVADVWANKFENAPAGYKGIRVASLRPKHGIFFMPGSSDVPLINSHFWKPKFINELEFLIMGGIDPNAVIEVVLYRNILEPDARDGKMQALARREENTIIFYDFARKITERYAFDENGKLKLESRSPLKEDDPSQQLPKDMPPPVQENQPKKIMPSQKWPHQVGTGIKDFTYDI